MGSKNPAARDCDRVNVWVFWSGAGILFGGSEIIGNAFLSRFPVLFEAFLNVPFAAIVCNGAVYLALWMLLGLAAGLLVETIRRIFKLSFSLHAAAAVGLTVSILVYLWYGIVASNLDNVDPSQGLPQGYRAPLNLWWWVIGGGLSAIVLLVAGYVTGFFRKSRAVLSCLAVIIPGIIAFNIADQSIGAGFSRIFLLAIVLAGVTGLYFMIKIFRPGAGQLLCAVAVVALAVILFQGAFYGWPGKNYERHLSLMIWDAQPAGRMNVYGYGVSNTPTLTAAKNHAVLFARAYSPANYTFASHVSIFTNRYLREHHLYDGTLEESALYAAFPNLAESMATRGYRSVLLTENPWLLPISKGFDPAVSCPTRSQAVKYFLPFYRDTFMVRQILNHISFNAEGDFKWTVLRIEKRLLMELLLKARRDGPYFFCTNWMYFHSRYCPTVPERISHRDLPQSAYDDCIRFADEYLRIWLGIFRDAGQLADSLFLLTADHGDFLGEFGLWGHGKTLLEPVLHVPLILFGEKVPAGTITTPVPLVALKPALEALVPASPGKDWNIPAFIGRMVNNRGMVVEGSFDFEGPDHSIRWFLAAWEGEKKYMQDAHKYIPGPSEGLDMDSFYFYYDLAADPGEKNNLAPSRPEEVAHMQKLISEWESRLHPVPLPAPVADEEGEYPPGLVEQLRALGYMR